jgi:hypothetical protein
VVFLWLRRDRAAAGLAVVAFVLAAAVARLAAAWQGVPAEVTGRVAPLAVAFLVPPAAYGAWELLGRFRAASLGTVLAVVGLLLVGWADGPGEPLARGLCVRTETMTIGFSDEQKRLLAAIEEHTTPEARILWDDADARLGGNWSALLPLYTNRVYLGGLDVDSEIDHGYCALCNQTLNGRALTDWTDAELTAYCRWYNVGWVVCRGGRTVERWTRYPQARVEAQLSEGGQPVVLLAIDRPRSFVLSGSAVWESADARRIVLTEVQPDASGCVLLSLHSFEGLRVYPSYVKLDAQSNPPLGDPIDHIRLRIPGRVPRVTLVWEHP